MKEWGAIVEGLYREGEDEISKNGYWSYLYAKEVVKGRFEKGEEMIKRDHDAWRWYINYLVSKGIEI